METTTHEADQRAAAELEAATAKQPPKNTEDAFAELSELQLAWVGGGSGINTF